MAASFQLPFDGERFGITSIARFAKRNRLRERVAIDVPPLPRPQKMKREARGKLIDKHCIWQRHKTYGTSENDSCARLFDI
ncbi:hypothetical protein [Paraburkholderia piptadeniae]|uniref:hypothetical protein n=1 Tax=Paraburkholderia piptadeniae TaxID=1701573 RepID=UPI000B3F94BD|nr:hypothetical protein [Paraburkholderia piptadeniae]